MAFNAHDKRVTLTLARYSARVKEIPGMVSALDALAQVDYDFDAAPQASQEMVFAHFDDELEAVIKSEFEADPEFLIDHKGVDATCQLCGQAHIRFEFNIKNVKGGVDVRCGSDCIITHGLCVKGTETAEEARAALEKAIRKQLKKLRIEAWHKATAFSATLFDAVHRAFQAIAADYTLPYNIRQKAKWARGDLRTLRNFYAKNGWLGTEKKWQEWIKIATIARQFGGATFAAPVSFLEAMGRTAVEVVEGTDDGEDHSTVPSFDEPEAPPADSELPQIAQPAPINMMAPAAPVGQPQPFAKITQQLVFGFAEGKQSK